MQHFTIKHIAIKIALSLAVACAPIIPASLQAAIPAGQLTQDEQKLLLVEMGKIKSYLGNIIAATNKFFSEKGNFPADLKSLQTYKDEIRTIAAKAPLGGSSKFAQDTFKFNKALAQKLAEAQTKWVNALSKKSLKALDAVEDDMNSIFDRVKAQIVGANVTFEGLKGYLTQADHKELIALVDSLYADVEYVFSFHVKNSIFKGNPRQKIEAMGNHLTKNKGFKFDISYAKMWSHFSKYYL